MLQPHSCVPGFSRCTIVVSCASCKRGERKSGTIYVAILVMTHGIFFCMYAAAAAKSLLSCPTLCDPTDGSPPGSPVPGILQARTPGVGCHFLLQCMKVKSESEVAQSCQLLATPWTAAYQSPPSMGFSRQEYWSGVPLPSPGDHTTWNQKN